MSRILGYRNRRVYLVRHGEVAHHQAEVSLTSSGREQAHDTGVALAGRVAGCHQVYIHHSPLLRVKETADILYASLRDTLDSMGVDAGELLAPPAPDELLNNFHFILHPEGTRKEPALLYERTNDPQRLASIPDQQAAFYRDFWTQEDPIGYWMNHDSGGGAETPELVLDELLDKIRGLMTGDLQENQASLQWILVTHSANLRVFLRAILGYDPGEPDYCEIVAINPGRSEGLVTIRYREETGKLQLM